MDLTKLKIRCSIIALPMLLSTSVLAAEAENAVSLTLGAGVGPDASADVVGVSYERGLSDKISVRGTLAGLSYEWDDGPEFEDGDATGLQADVRFYPGGNALDGFYLGGGIGLWDSEWDSGRDGVTFNRGSSTAVEAHFIVGNKFTFGTSGIFVEPTAILGAWISGDSESESIDSGDLVAVITISVGKTF